MRSLETVYSIPEHSFEEWPVLPDLLRGFMPVIDHILALIVALLVVIAADSAIIAAFVAIRVTLGAFLGAIIPREDSARLVIAINSAEGLG